MQYVVRLYRKEGWDTAEMGPYRSAGDAWAECDRQMASGQYGRGLVDAVPDDHRGQDQANAPWWGK